MFSLARLVRFIHFSRFRPVFPHSEFRLAGWWVNAFGVSEFVFVDFILPFVLLCLCLSVYIYAMCCKFMPLIPLPLSTICLLCTRPRLSGSFCYQWVNRVEQHAKLWCLCSNEWYEVRSLCSHPFFRCSEFHRFLLLFLLLFRFGVAGKKAA